jgi:hypothetical protein
MKNTGRVSLILLLLGLLFILGILFRAYILDYLVMPVTTLLWYLWRILSTVDQAFYWGTLVFLALLYITFSVFLRQFLKPESSLPAPPPASNATLENIHYWRMTILVTKDEMAESNILKRKLGKMLATMYASKQAGASTMEFYEALNTHHIPLPDHVYTFLFPDESIAARRSFAQVLRSLWQVPRNWIRRWTKQDVAEYYQSIDQVIALMESTMEIENDAEPIKTS